MTGELTLKSASAIRTTAEKRFTRDGSNELEWRLARLCEKVLSGVRGIIPRYKLEAIMLGGGYGRGEGGVLSTEAGDQPYNDLEFYVLVRGNRFVNRRFHSACLDHLAEELSHGAGVEIEFKIISLAELRRSGLSMFYYDLVMGHRWIFGNENLLSGCGHHRAAQLIPMSEATRLMMNRCSGLLFAREKLRRGSLTAGDADFVERNLAKARLAFGDAVLTAFGQYHWSCLERHNRLSRLSLPERLPWLAMVCRQHVEGVKFKLHPRRSVVDPTILQTQLEELATLGLQLWLSLESRRLGQEFASAQDYALSNADKCPETHFWRNCIIIARSLGPQKLWEPGPTNHPRQRVLHALTLLLWEPTVLDDPRLLSRLQRELCSTESNREILLTAYEAIWARFK